MSKGLEALEYIKHNIFYFEPICQEDEDKINQVNEIIEKELKALEIIKRVLNIPYKKVEIENWEIMRYITKKEYDLLKEVLL